LVADAKEGLLELTAALQEYKAPASWTENAKSGKADWQKAAAKVTGPTNVALPSDAQVIGAVQRTFGAEATVLHAAGGLPGEMHKLWQAGAPGSYHAEYGFSCMGYEIAGGLGIKMADPQREVYVLVGDGSYLMLSADIVTSIQEGYKLTIILMDNHGYKSIGGLSRSLGSQGFGTRFVYPEKNRLPDDTADAVHTLPVDLAANARSLGAHVIECETYEDFLAALESARGIERTTVIYIQNDRYVGVPGYESWWDVAVAEVSEVDSVKATRADYEQAVQKERYFLR
jgi:3D-(3,5/4)-trihydroxycyclohexane-1,2-dione acylhydrolase (decyclizing)